MFRTTRFLLSASLMALVAVSPALATDEVNVAAGLTAALVRPRQMGYACR